MSHGTCTANHSIVTQHCDLERATLTSRKMKRTHAMPGPRLLGIPSIGDRGCHCAWCSSLPSADNLVMMGAGRTFDELLLPSLSLTKAASTSAQPPLALSEERVRAQNGRQLGYALSSIAVCSQQGSWLSCRIGACRSGASPLHCGTATFAAGVLEFYAPIVRGSNCPSQAWCRKGGG